MRKKLENGEYPNASKFKEDFALMIRNCMAFNPAGTAVHDAGVELQRVFEEKWSHLPPLRTMQSEDEDEDVGDDSDDERLRMWFQIIVQLQNKAHPFQGAIADMEAQIETMRGNLAALKSQSKMKRKEKKEKRVVKHASPPAVSSSRPAVKPQKSAPKKRSSKKSAIPDDDVLSFDQKKDLSETIQNLDGDKLERVIQIIHEGVPEIRDVSNTQVFFISNADIFCRVRRRSSSISINFRHMCS